MTDVAVKLKRLIFAISVLFASPSRALDMSTIETTVRECKTSAICSCPREKIALVEAHAICGDDPPIVLDKFGNWANKRDEDTYGACLRKVADQNEMINQYNSLASECRMKEAQESRYAQRQAAIQQQQELQRRQAAMQEEARRQAAIQEEARRQAAMQEEASRQAAMREEARRQAEMQQQQDELQRARDYEAANAQRALQSQPSQQEQLAACLAAVRNDPSVISRPASFAYDCLGAQAGWQVCVRDIIPSCIAAINSGAFSSR